MTTSPLNAGCPWCRNFIQRAIADQGRAIRLPVHVDQALSKLRRARARHKEATGREPTEAELVQATGLGAGLVRTALGASSAPPLSLDALAFDDDGTTLGDAIADPEAVDPEAALLAKERASETRLALAALPEKERAVVEARFALDGGEPQTFATIGRTALGGRVFSPVQQVQANALDRMRRRMPDVRLG